MNYKTRKFFYGLVIMMIGIYFKPKKEPDTFTELLALPSAELWQFGVTVFLAIVGFRIMFKSVKK
tara:strand:+ start:6305 stop:6499 length:195 start_codon:yes stop_codon:yes gene_type:complete